MTIEHDMLRRQIEEHLGDTNVPDGIRALLDEIERTYHRFDDERETFERVLQRSTQGTLQSPETRLMLSAFPDMIVQVNSEGRIINAQPGKPTAHYATTADVTGRQIHDWCAALGDAVDATRANRLPHECEFELELRGERHWFEARTVAALGDHIIAIVRNVTHQKCVEHQLVRAKEEAERAMRAKSDFLATMSHEIRTPMNAMLGMSHLLGETTLDDEQRHCVDTMRESGESLLVLIDDILDFAKIEAGNLELERTEFDFESTVEASVEMLAEDARKKGLDLRLRIEPDIPHRLVGDPCRLRQVLVNLIGNAIKFTESGCVTTNVTIEEQDGAWTTVRFRIADTGIGIDPSTRHKLFRPFSQADASTTRKFGGTGLGLAICRNLVDLMEGEIDCRNREIGGSEFTFTGRFVCADPRTPRGIDSDARPRILLVDADETRRDDHTRLLEAWGCAVRTVAGRDAALARLQATRGAEEHPDLIIVDQAAMLELPLAMRSSGIDLPVIPVTNAPRQDALRLASRLGLDGCLSMPLTRRTTIAQIEKATGATPKPKAHAGTAPDEPVTGHAANILVVEDNAVNRRVVGMMLERLGHKVSFARNGKSGVEAWQGGSYDLIFMDCQMPEMDGFEATREIRHRQDDTKPVPIIALTANALPEDRLRCLDAGMDDYLSKPIRPKTLAAKLDEWLA